jgi:hypothetical protein
LTWWPGSSCRSRLTPSPRRGQTARTSARSPIRGASARNLPDLAPIGQCQPTQRHPTQCQPTQRQPTQRQPSPSQPTQRQRNRSKRGEGQTGRPAVSLMHRVAEPAPAWPGRDQPTPATPRSGRTGRPRHRGTRRSGQGRRSGGRARTLASPGIPASRGGHPGHACHARPRPDSERQPPTPRAHRRKNQATRRPAREGIGASPPVGAG